MTLEQILKLTKQEIVNLPEEDKAKVIEILTAEIERIANRNGK